MSAGAPSSSILFPMDDRDLDDAELWAVIDSAAASRSRKPLLTLKHTNSPNPIPAAPSLNTRIFRSAAEFRVPADGEVVQEESFAFRRPQKAARLSDLSGGDRRMVVVRTPPAYSSPPQQPGRFSVKEMTPVVESPPPDHWQRRNEVSPVVESPQVNNWQFEEKENMRHCLSGQFPSISTFKKYQSAAIAILDKTDYAMISGNPFIKKSGWRKISFFFNLSFEIKDKSIEFDENRNVQRAEFIVRAYMQGGRFSDGWGSCERREKRFQKPNHDIPSTAETRAKNRACQDLLGIGDYRSSAGDGPR